MTPSTDLTAETVRSKQATLDLLLKITRTQAAHIKLLESRMDSLERKHRQTQATVTRMREIFRQQGYPRI